MSWMPTSCSCGLTDGVGHILGAGRRPTGQGPRAAQSWSPRPLHDLGPVILVLAAWLVLVPPTQGLCSMSITPHSAWQMGVPAAADP